MKYISEKCPDCQVNRIITRGEIVCPNCGRVFELYLPNKNIEGNSSAKNTYNYLRRLNQLKKISENTATRWELQTHLDHLKQPYQYSVKDWTGIIAAVVGSELQKYKYTEPAFQAIICAMCVLFYKELNRVQTIDARLFTIEYHKKIIFLSPRPYSNPHKYFDIPLAKQIIAQYIAKFY